MADFEAWLVFLILVVNVVGELQRKKTLAASRGFLAAARLSCLFITLITRHATSCDIMRLSESPRISCVTHSVTSRRKASGRVDRTSRNRKLSVYGNKRRRDVEMSNVVCCDNSRVYQISQQYVGYTAAGRVV